jgi:hypothetical protein
VRREIFLEAVFLWMMPFDAAMSSAFIACPRAFSASPRAPAEIADSTFFTKVFKLLITLLFRKFLLILCRALFIAERFFFGLAFAGNVNLLNELDYKNTITDS